MLAKLYRFFCIAFFDFEEHAYDIEIEFERLNELDESYIIRLEELKESERKRIFRK